MPCTVTATNPLSSQATRTLSRQLRSRRKNWGYRYESLTQSPTGQAPSCKLWRRPTTLCPQKSSLDAYCQTGFTIQREEQSPSPRIGKKGHKNPKGRPNGGPWTLAAEAVGGF